MTHVVVSTPSRLHFGLLRLHEAPGRSYGGLGMMIDRPRVELQLAAAPEWSVNGPGAKRAAAFAKRALNSLDLPVKPSALHIEIRSIVPQHRGLGGGTQLALAIAAGLRELVGLPPGSATELAAAVGRGARSAVGSHGFVHGGLIWERGRTSKSPLSDLTERVALPSEWRIVLVTPPRGRGLSGTAERRAFNSLPPVPAVVTQQLELLAEQRILPAATAADVDAFGEAIHEYGRIAGDCFAAVQGGPYASPETAACVDALRSMGVRGVGQSSWGPTVFAITPSMAAAANVAKSLSESESWSKYAIDIASADNTGAQLKTVASESQPPGAASRTAWQSG